MNNLVFGKPFLLYHRSGHSPRPCSRSKRRVDRLNQWSQWHPVVEGVGGGGGGW